MTFQTALDAGAGVSGVDAVLLIDGIPVAFGTRAGIVFDTSSVFLNGPASLTTVDALTGDLRFDGQSLDMDQLMVLPGSASCTLRSDLQWDRYFQRRRSPRARIITAPTPTATTISLDSAAGFTAGRVAYVDRECVLVGGVSGGDLTGCARAYAALPNQTLARHAVGARVTASPSNLVGRMAEVWLHLNGEWSLERRLFVDGITRVGTTGPWSLSFTDTMRLLERQVAVGLDAIPVQRMTVSVSSDTPSRPVLTLQLAGAFAWLPATTTEGLYVHVQGGEDDTALDFFAKVKAVDNVTGDISVEDAQVDALLGGITSAVIGVGGARGQTADVSAQGFTVRLVQKLNGTPLEDLLRVLTSTNGDTDNGQWDTLFGSTTNATSGTATEGEEERRFGAAIPAALIDVAGIESLAGESAPGWTYWLGATGQTDVRSFVEEALWAAQCYMCVRDGKLTVRKLAGVTSAVPIAANIDDDVLSRDGKFECIDDEREAVHSMSVRCNMDPVTGELMGTVNIRDARQYETFRDSAPVPTPLERYGLAVVSPQRGTLPENQVFHAASYSDLVSRFDKMLHRRMLGIRKWEVTVPFANRLQPGDIIRLTSAHLDAFNGGSVNGLAVEVVSSGGWDFEKGQRTFTCWETFATKPVSPSANVASWSTDTATLTTSHRFGGGTTPGRLFAVGWKCRILDKSATPPFSTASGVLTVAAVTDTTVQFTGTVGFTPAAGDILVQAQYDNADSTVQNTSSYAQRDYAFQADANARLGSSDAQADEWG